MGHHPPRHVLCAGAVVTRGGRLLMIRERSGKHTGQWGIPWGFVDEGETPDAAAARECLEEAGIHVAISGLLAVQTLPGALGGAAFVFAAHPVSDTDPRPDGDETDAAAYLSIAEMDERPVERWCRWLADRVLFGVAPIHEVADNPYRTPAWLASPA
jgi:8-oxo-dGTP diphosphatase